MDQRIPKLQVGLTCKYGDGTFFVVSEISRDYYTIIHSKYGDTRHKIADFDWAATTDIQNGGVYSSKQLTLQYIKQVLSENRG
jgi:hypothetical protein